MKVTRHLYRSLFLAVAVMLAAGAEIAGAAQKPNIVFILADDLGYGRQLELRRTAIRVGLRRDAEVDPRPFLLGF